MTFRLRPKDEILRLAGLDEVEDLKSEANKSDVATPNQGVASVEVDQSLPPPQTGISIPMAPSPRFIRSVPEEPELLYSAPESLFDEIVRAEAERISQPEGIRNRIVYDSVGDPFKTEVTSVPREVKSNVFFVFFFLVWYGE